MICVIGTSLNCTTEDKEWVFNSGMEVDKNDFVPFQEKARDVLNK
jgi:hypothetical protein